MWFRYESLNGGEQLERRIPCLFSGATGGGEEEEEEKKIHEGCTAWLKLLFPIRKPSLGK
jgi:hypothetical protein